MPFILFLKMYFFNCNSSPVGTMLLYCPLRSLGLCVINTQFFKENYGHKLTAVGVVFFPVYILY